MEEIWDSVWAPGGRTFSRYVTRLTQKAASSLDAVAKPAHVQIRVKKLKLMQTGIIPSTHPRVISTLFHPKIPLSALSDDFAAQRIPRQCEVSMPMTTDSQDSSILHCIRTSISTWSNASRLLLMTCLYIHHIPDAACCLHLTTHSQPEPLASLPHSPTI